MAAIGIHAQGAGYPCIRSVSSEQGIVMRTLIRSTLFALVAGLSLVAAAHAQNANGGNANGNGGNANNGGNNNGNGGGNITGAAGVIIGPDGVLKMRFIEDPNGQLAFRRKAEAMARLAGNLVQQAPIRKVSLNKLEAAIAARAANGQQPTDEMKYLAGLTRAQYVFFYPDTQDIVIAGPAEGFMPDATGRVVGMNTGRAILELQDLVVALRAYPPTGKPTQVLGCSIDPTPEGLAALQKYFKGFGGKLPSGAGVEQRIARDAAQALGLQNVSIRGVSPKTHFAQVLVEADYRMKLIGIGLEQPPVRIQSFPQLATGNSANGMARWFFVPNYECVKVTEDELALELVGDGVELVGEDEVVQADGSRIGSGGQNKGSKQFCQQFTKNYPQLAARSPVYAQLRNLIDMSVMAAFIQKSDYYKKCGWKMEHFGDEKKFAVETQETPKQVETACNVYKKGNSTSWPIGGGVEIQATRALDTDHRIPDDGGKLQALRGKTHTDKLAENQWWWD